jgi:hypothetical protein
MQQSKNITIQVWTDNYYCKVIGIWRPHEEPGAIPEDTNIPQDSVRINLPHYIVLSSVYEPRSEVMGHNPVAPGQHPIPTEFLEDQTRHISYMFANDVGVFKPPTKNHAGSFMARQTMGYKLKKEIKREVRPASGSMNMKQLRDSLNQFSDSELEGMPVMVMGEHPKDIEKRKLDSFLYTAKSDNPEEISIPQYITVTKSIPVYELEDPYINNSPITADHIEKSLPPETEDFPASKELIDGAMAAAETDQLNRESLAMADELKALEPVPILDAKGNPVLDDDGKPMVEEPPVIDRVRVLEELLKKKEQQLVDAGLAKKPIDTTKETIPAPAESYYNTDGSPRDLDKA